MPLIDKKEKRRINNTIAFLEEVAPLGKILDLGEPNLLSRQLIKCGYEVENTKGEDFDVEYKKIKEYKADLITSFEVFEHLLSPYNILKEIEITRLVATVPLNMWFAKAQWNENVKRNRHFHEFEKRQFDWLLEETGWEIKKSELWIAPIRTPGIRPILRLFIPRFYAVYCER